MQGDTIKPHYIERLRKTKTGRDTYQEVRLKLTVSD